MKAKAIDFSKGHPNPHAAKLNKRVVLSVPPDVVAYFQSIADEIGTTADHIMWVYLNDCAAQKRVRPPVLQRATRLVSQKRAALVVNPKKP